MYQHSKDEFVTELAQRDEARLVEATHKMVRSLKKLPDPRDLFSQIFTGTRHPWRTLLWLHEVAIRAGAPKEDVLAFAYELIAWVESRYPAEELPSLPECSRLEQAAQCATDPVQLDAAYHADPVTLERLEERLRVQLRASRQLAERVERERRAARPNVLRPMGVPTPPSYPRPAA